MCVCVCAWVGGGILFPGTILCGMGFGEMVLHGMFAGLSLTTKEATTICKIVEILPRKIGLSR